MKIVVFGTGHVGGVLVSELAGRGHQVTAVSRFAKTDLPARVAAVGGSVHDSAFVGSVTAGSDAIAAALPALSPEGSLGAAVTVLLHAAQKSEARLGVVGGAAIIPTTPGGPREADNPDFPARLIPIVDAHQQTLDILNSAPEDIDWFYLVPAAEFGAANPGTRTGSYRTSNTAQVTNEQGRSVLGAADYAIAFSDEFEKPRTHRAWLAIGY